MHCVWTIINCVSAQAAVPALSNNISVWLKQLLSCFSFVVTMSGLTNAWPPSHCFPAVLAFLNLLVSFSTSLHSLASQSNLLFGREEGLCWYCTLYTSATQLQHAAFPKYLLHRGTAAQFRKILTAKFAAEIKKCSLCRNIIALGQLWQHTCFVLLYCCWIPQMKTLNYLNTKK